MARPLGQRCGLIESLTIDGTKGQPRPRLMADPAVLAINWRSCRRARCKGRPGVHGAGDLWPKRCTRARPARGPLSISQPLLTAAAITSSILVRRDMPVTIFGISERLTTTAMPTAGATTSSFLWARLARSPTAIPPSSPHLPTGSSNTSANFGAGRTPIENPCTRV